MFVIHVSEFCFPSANTAKSVCVTSLTLRIKGICNDRVQLHQASNQPSHTPKPDMKSGTCVADMSLGKRGFS